MRNQLYIDGALVDLFQDTIISITRQYFDPFDITSRQVGFTNVFNIPKTSANNIIFEHADFVGSQSSKPYKKLSAKYIQEGIEVVSRGIAYMREVGSVYKVYVIGSSFFDSIEGKLICDIDFGESIVTWDNTQIDTSRKDNSSVLLAPFISYSENYFGVGANFVMPAVVPPTIRYKNIIEKMISNAGYAKDGDMFNDTKYQAMAVAFSRPKFDYGGTFKSKREFDAIKTANQTVTNPGAGYAVITFDSVIGKNSLGWYDAGTGRYATSGSDTRDFRAKFFVTIEFELVSGTYHFEIRDNSGTQLSGSRTVNYSVPGKYRIAFAASQSSGTDIEGWKLIFNDWIEPRCVVGVAGEIRILSGRFYNEVMGENFQSSNPTFYPNEILPDMSQSDMINDFTLRFGVIFSESNSTIKCRSFKNIINDKSNAINLTSKHVPNPASELIDFKSSLAKVNNFTYNGDDSFTSFRKSASDGHLFLNDERLDAESSLYESIFDGTFNASHTNGSFQVIPGAFIKIWNLSAPANYLTTFDNEPGNRLLLLREKFSSEPIVNYSTNRSDYLIGYFDRHRYTGSDFPQYSLDWNSFIAEYYGSIRQSLEKPKIVTRYYNLNTIDVMKLNALNLIYDSGAYYLLTEIEKFISGRETKLKLLRID